MNGNPKPKLTGRRKINVDQGEWRTNSFIVVVTSTLFLHQSQLKSTTGFSLSYYSCCKPSLIEVIEPMLVSKKEHIFGKKTFCTRAKFLEKGRFHEISVQCIKQRICGSGNLSSSICGFDSEMEIRIGGHLAIHLKQTKNSDQGGYKSLGTYIDIIRATRTHNVLGEKGRRIRELTTEGFALLLKQNPCDTSFLEASLFEDTAVVSKSIHGTCR